MTGTFVAFQKDSAQTAQVMRYGPGAAPPSNAAESPIADGRGRRQLRGWRQRQVRRPLRRPRRHRDRARPLAARRRSPKPPGSPASVPSSTPALGIAAKGFDASERLGATLSPAAFAREEQAYAQRLGATAGGLPTFAAPAGSDLDARSSLATFQAAFSGFGAPLGSAPPGAGIVPISRGRPGPGVLLLRVRRSAGGRRAGDRARLLRPVRSATPSAAGSPGSWPRPGPPAPRRLWSASATSPARANAAADSGQVVPILAPAAAPPAARVGNRPAPPPTSSTSRNRTAPTR